MGGFLQRIDYVRKYAFGVMCILKDDKGQFPIRCAPSRPLTPPDRCGGYVTECAQARGRLLAWGVAESRRPLSLP